MTTDWQAAFERMLSDQGKPSDYKATSGGSIVPDGAWEDILRVHRASSWLYVSDETLEDMGYPPRAKGLRYWQDRERRAVAAAHPVARIKRRVWRVRSFMDDVPRRLTNARAALAGQWERLDDDD